MTNEIEEAFTLTPIHDFLVRNQNKREIRCYMPGHKGTENPLDITEISGADSLYDTDFFSENPGIIAQSEQAASGLFGTEQTLYSCSGSTLAIQTMLALAKQKSKGKDHIVAGRYSHRSFINSCILLGLTPSWAYPKDYLSADISPDEIEKKITDRTMAVFINSIDYYGGMSDIPKIAEVCKKHCIPLLVDNAHGAYLRFLTTDCHPITLGADMCADSAHKTLPVLTGGAYLHIRNKKYCENAKETMALFGTSSPSYLILDSLDRFNATIYRNPRHIRELAAKIAQLKADVNSYGFTLFPSDSFRLTLDCAATYGTGLKAAAALKELGVECEYADDYKCVLLFGWSTSDEDLSTVREVFRALSPAAFAQYNMPLPPQHIITAQSMSPAKAYFKMKYKLPISDAVGKTCAVSVAPCPPGIPLIMPGETISKQAASELERRGIKDICVVM